MAGVRIDFEPIVPEELQIDEVRLELLNELRKQGVQIRNLYKKTVKTWKKKPRFELKPKFPRVSNPAIEVHTDSEIYGYIDEGTKPRIIRARRAPFLRFRVPYRAATKPRWLSSRRARQGKDWVSKKSVRHPGIKAREFSATIHKRRQRPFNTGMKKAMAKGLKKAQRG